MRVNMVVRGELEDDMEMKVPVQITTIETGREKEVIASLDTGGFYTLISASLAESLNLKKRRDINVVGPNATSEQPVYYIILHLDDLVNKVVSVVGCNVEGSNFISIGRDILKEWDIDYRGPGRTFEIRNPSTQHNGE